MEKNVSPIVVAQNVSKNFQEGKLAVNVLSEVNLTVEQGELVSIVGTSGSGQAPSILTIRI